MTPLAFPCFALSSRRQKSFEIGWQGLFPEKLTEFVAAGFFWINLNDIVVCAFCGNHEDDWHQGEIVLARLLKNFPACIEMKATSVPPHPLSVVHPWYSTFYSRIRTYGFWPEQLAQTPKALARAGLFYKKQGDMDPCFMCDVDLFSWTSIIHQQTY